MRLIIRRAPGPYAPRTVVDGRCPKLGSTLTQLGARYAPAQEQSGHHAALTANLDPAKRNACAQYAFGLLLTATNLFDNRRLCRLARPAPRNQVDVPLSFLPLTSSSREQTDVATKAVTNFCSLPLAGSSTGPLDQ